MPQSVKRLRVGIDARFASFPGLGTYTHTVVEALSKRTDVEIVLYSDTGTRFQRFGVEEHSAPPGQFSLRSQLLWPRLLRSASVDAFHALHFDFPLFASVPLVVTIHDLVYLNFRITARLATLRHAYYSFMHHAAVRKATALVVGSTFAQSEVNKFFGRTLPRTYVIHHSVSPWFRTAPSASVGSSTKNPYILYVGTNKPWKRLNFLLELFPELRRTHPDIQLVVAGKMGANDAPPDLSQLSVEDRAAVMMVGAVSNEALRDLYHNARAVVCPSVYEGFGLTALEAMACGAPVVASDVAAHAEVIGAGGVLVPPNDPQQWISALSILWSSQEERRGRSEAALRRAALFDPAHFSDRLRRVYQYAVRRNG